jgi:hypothetical protein
MKKNDTFYYIWLAIAIIMACIAIASILYAVKACDKAGGRYMGELFGMYQCVVQEKTNGSR